MSPIITRTENEIAKVLVVIDTEGLRKKYPRHLDNTAIEIDKEYWYTLSSKQANVATSLHAILICTKDKKYLQLSGISLDTNASDAIIINQIQKENLGSHVLTPFVTYCYTTFYIIQNPHTDTINDSIITHKNCIQFTATINNDGAEKIMVLFSMYYSDVNGNQQIYYGQFYFYVDVYISTKD